MITPGQMGIASVHEHIPTPSDPALREASMQFAIRELKKAREGGLRTIAEVKPGSDAATIREISKASGVEVICCTGSYVLGEEQQALTVDDFERPMIRDFEEGLQNSGILPGVIKVASRKLPITPAERNLFVAAARVQRRYGVPICTHAVTGCAEQQAILKEAGADLEHCYYSHVEASQGWQGRSLEQQIGYLKRVVEQGGTLCFNNFGNWAHTAPEDLARIILELLEAGFDDHMVATMDTTWSFRDSRIHILWAEINEDGPKRTYDYLLGSAVPWMKEMGIPEDSVRKFIVDNPRRLFAI